MERHRGAGTGWQSAACNSTTPMGCPKWGPPHCTDENSKAQGRGLPQPAMACLRTSGNGDRGQASSGFHNQSHHLWALSKTRPGRAAWRKVAGSKDRMRFSLPQPSGQAGPGRDAPCVGPRTPSSPRRGCQAGRGRAARAGVVWGAALPGGPAARVCSDASHRGPPAPAGPCAPRPGEGGVAGCQPGRGQHAGLSPASPRRRGPT